MAFRHMAYALVALCWVFRPAAADTLALQPNAPERYVVVKGDTLWDISEKFLRDPWLWPEIWQVNPEISNPHLIYPGDTILLTYDKEGRPVLTLQRGTPAVKLSPQARPERVDTAIPTIPVDAIHQFLTKAGVMTPEEYEKLPYVVSFQDERLIAGVGETAYVRGIKDANQTRYAIVRLGDPYRDPTSGKGEILGYELLETGSLELKGSGDPVGATITSVTREILGGDRLVPLSDEPLRGFIPHAPAADAEGRIIAVVDGVSRIGQHHVVVLNLGAKQGMEQGHVMAVYQAGRTVHDPFSDKRGGEAVTLPDERAGLVMVFRVFDRVSYALVTRSHRDMRVLDKVKNPGPTP